MSTAFFLSDLKLIFKRRTHSEREIRFPFTLVLIRKVNTILDYSSKLISCLWASFQAIGTFQNLFSKSRISFSNQFSDNEVLWSMVILLTVMLATLWYWHCQDFGDRVTMLVIFECNESVTKISNTSGTCHKDLLSRSSI